MILSEEGRGSRGEPEMSHWCLSAQGFSEDSWAVMLTQMQRCGSLVIVRAGSGMNCPSLHLGGTVLWLSKWGK